ncbi:MAG: VWA domain-containing protein [Candidatus Sulfotelmatobacter sp.]
MTFVIAGYLRALESSHRLSKCPVMALLSHRHGWSLAVLLSLFPFVFASDNPRDPPPTTFHTRASEVRISFFATDENNRLVNDVGKDDFAVVDNEEVIRNFRSLARSDETPLDVVILVDASASVKSSFHQTMRDVVSLLSSPQLAHPHIIVVRFAGLTPDELCSGDCRASAAQEELLASEPSGATPLYDALQFTAELISRRRAPDVRELLLLYSDGDDTVSKTSPRDALDAVVTSDALLYAINLNRSENSPGDAVLQQFARATGGRSFSIKNGSVSILQSILQDLRASYIVTYQLPSHAAGFHSLRILPKHNLNLRFHCRRGYFYAEKE